MDRPELSTIAERIERLPTLPEAYTVVSEMLENPKVSASDVADAISGDPALTAKILKIVNSAFYGLPQQVATLTHALVLLGFNTVKSLILAMGLSEIFGPTSNPRFPRPDFWTHCFATGMIAKSLAGRLGYPKVEEVFIQGLLHDVGKIVLDQYEPEAFDRITAIVEAEDILILEAEREILGFDHADIGAMVIRRWNLPPQIAETVGGHHHPDRSDGGGTEAAIVHLADILCRAKQIGTGGDRRIPAISPAAWKTLSVDWKSVAMVLEETVAMEDSGGFFG